MTRLAIISDVHAVQDALAHIDRMGCDLVVCAGDIVDYGLFPEETIALLRERGVTCIRGNHDRWAVGRGRADAPEDTGVPVHDASGFDLSSDAIKFLASLPTRWDAVPDGVRIAARHGTPKSEMEVSIRDSLSGSLRAAGSPMRRQTSSSSGSPFTSFPALERAFIQAHRAENVKA